MLMLMMERYNEARPTPTSSHGLKQSLGLNIKRALAEEEVPSDGGGALGFYFWFTDGLPPGNEDEGIMGPYFRLYECSSCSIIPA